MMTTLGGRDGPAAAKVSCRGSQVTIAAKRQASASARRRCMGFSPSQLPRLNQFQSAALADPNSIAVRGRVCDAVSLRLHCPHVCGILLENSHHPPLPESLNALDPGTCRPL